MVSKRNNENRHWLVMILPFLLTLLPVPLNPNLQAYIYPLTIFILFFLITKWITNYEFNNYSSILIVINVLYILAIILSLGTNYQSSLLDVAFILKPIYFIVILIFGIFVGEKRTYTEIINGLLKSAYIILFVQLVIGGLQLLDIHTFDFIYSAEKAWPLGKLMRIVGTMGNPNTFGWFVIQMAVVIFLYESNIRKRNFYLIITTVFIFVSGSRSMLLIYPFSLLLSKMLTNKKKVVYRIMYIPIYITIIVIVYLFLVWFLENYGYMFPYLEQLLPVLTGDSLDSVSSFLAREQIWENRHSIFQEYGNYTSLLFGLGVNTFDFVDNGFLYALYNTGIFGLLINILLFIVPLIIFIKVDAKKFRAIGIQYVLFSLVLNIQSDVISGWIYPSLLMYYTGIAAVWIKKGNTEIKPNDVKLNL